MSVLEHCGCCKATVRTTGDCDCERGRCPNCTPGYKAPCKTVGGWPMTRHFINPNEGGLIAGYLAFLATYLDRHATRSNWEAY